MLNNPVVDKLNYFIR